MAQPSVWRTAVTDLAWKAGPRCSPPAALVLQQIRSGILVHWPSSYARPSAEEFIATLRRGLSELVEVEQKDIPQHWPRVVVFEISIDGIDHPIAVDYVDSTDIDVSCADSVPLYFKMQYRQEGYGRSNVVPGGYVSARLFLHDYYCRLRRKRQTGGFDVYGSFGDRFSTEIRREAVDRLSAQNRFSFDGGMFTYGGSAGPSIVYTEHLRRAARAKICIDLPGNGPFCYRLVDYLGVGSCVIAIRHRAKLFTDLVDRKHIVYCKDDMSDLIELCTYYLTEEEARLEIENNAARYFDENLHYTRFSAHYLKVAMSELLPSN